MAAAPLKFPAFITGSTWSNVYSALQQVVVRKRGIHEVTGTQAPRLTNGEAITVIQAWMPALVHAGIRSDAMPLWSQFAAAAYAWNPATGKFDVSARQRDAWYPDLLLLELWLALYRAALDLDDLDANQPTKRIDLDGQWSDIVFQNIVKHDVETDGAITDTQSAHAAFKIPMPACKGKDGKLRAPKCKRVMKRWPYLCEEWEKCEPVVVDDPITKVGNDLGKLASIAILIGAVWVLFDNKPKRRRARR